MIDFRLMQNVLSPYQLRLTLAINKAENSGFSHMADALRYWLRQDLRKDWGK